TVESPGPASGKGHGPGALLPRVSADAPEATPAVTPHTASRTTSPVSTSRTPSPVPASRAETSQPRPHREAASSAGGSTDRREALAIASRLAAELRSRYAGDGAARVFGAPSCTKAIEPSCPGSEAPVGVSTEESEAGRRASTPRADTSGLPQSPGALPPSGSASPAAPPPSAGASSGAPSPPGGASPGGSAPRRHAQTPPASGAD